MNSARSKSADAAIKSNLDGIRSSASIAFEDLGNTYNNTGSDVDSAVCEGLVTSGTVLEVASISNAISEAALKSGSDAICKITGTSYLIAVPLKTDPTQYWCVDSESKGIMLNATPSGLLCE